MIKSKHNQLWNVKNPNQGNSIRTLTVCSAGLLRSPTIAKYLSEEHNMNTRSCGTSKEYALVPLTEALIVWADILVFAHEECYSSLDEDELQCIKEENKEVIILDIPDEYCYNQAELVALIHAQYTWKLYMDRTKEQGDLE